MITINEISQYLPEFSALVAAHALAVASPGPDFAVVTKNAITYGKNIGRITALGVGVAILLHVSYALLGFSLLVESSPLLFKIIKWIGALFLVYLGIMSLRAQPIDFDSDYAKSQQNISFKKAFGIGFFTNALNIKAMLFFLFLFTSFVKESTPIGVKIFYGIWLSVYTFLWFYFLASVFGHKKVRQFFSKFGVWFDKGMGILLILLALLLVMK